MEKVFSDPDKTLLIPIDSLSAISIDKNFYLCVNIFWISLFCYFYVRWLREVHRTAISITFVRDFVIHILPLGIASLGLLGSVALMYFANLVSPFVITYGVLLTASWFITIILALWRPY